MFKVVYRNLGAMLLPGLLFDRILCNDYRLSSKEGKRCNRIQKFPCQDTSIASLISWEKPFTDYRDLYMESERICNLLDPWVLSARVVIYSFKEIRDDVHKLMIGEVDKSKFSTSTSKGHEASLVMKIERKMQAYE